MPLETNLERDTKVVQVSNASGGGTLSNGETIALESAFATTPIYINFIILPGHNTNYSQFNFKPFVYVFNLIRDCLLSHSMCLPPRKLIELF